MPHWQPRQIRVFTICDDVLRQIVDHLHGGGDALSISLTSKHIYDLAMHRISLMIECKSSNKLQLLHRTMVHDNHVRRAQHIRKLVIHKYVSTYQPSLYDHWLDTDTEDEFRGDEKEDEEMRVAALIRADGIILRPGVATSDIPMLSIECFEPLCLLHAS